MADEKIGMRYAHSEGHTSLCYDDDGSFLFTCGGDGDVRIWKDLEDDDPESKHVGELVYSIVFKKNRFLVSTEANSILAYTFPDTKPDGLVTRFSAPANHMCLSKDGGTLLAGSSDFSIKVIKVVDNSFKVLLGHEAPILSVDLDPMLEYAASSSCDGSVRIWRIGKQACVKSWANMVPTSNEFCASKVLCRLAWQPVNGKMLAIPVDKSVKCFSRDSWDGAGTLTDDAITEPLNLVKFSNCGRYIAGACINGTVVVWDVEKRTCIKREKHEKKLTICDVQWNPKENGELAFCDVQGQLGVFVNMTGTSETITSVNSYIKENPAIQLGKARSDSPNDLPLLEDDDDDENTFSISKIKAETVGLENLSDDDEYLNDAINKQDIPTIGSIVDKATFSTANLHDSAFKLSHIQESFQPGSTPVHYRHRFMVWNSVGIVRGYNTEEESVIDVEFHDSATHHSLHLENTAEHTMADLSSTAVLMACRAKNGNLSKLMCNNFGAWDSSKEWTVDLPEDENIEAIAVGPEWAAAATDQRQLRLFNVGGIQRHVVSIPGPVVAMSGHVDQLIVAYHQGMGIPGDQCLGMMRINLANKKVLTSNCTLPLSPKSTLSWIGFTDEGNPCSSDSAGVVRFFPRSLGETWVQIANTKNHTKGKSDNYFVVGLSESQQHIRCILCKGARYPSTLPHPMVMVLPFVLPLCGLSSEKGKLEDSYWRYSLLLDTFAYLDEQGYETDSILSERAKKTRKEDLIKLFALSCRGDRESCALELAQMMDSHQTVQLAIKYASRQKRLQLAQRVGEVAYQKMEMEEEEKQVDDEFKRTTSTSLVSQGRRPVNLHSNDRFAFENYSEMDRGSENFNDFTDSNDACTSLSNQEINSQIQPVVANNEWSNPFRASSASNRTSFSGKRSSILDNLPMCSTPKAKPTSNAAVKDKSLTSSNLKAATKVQGTLKIFNPKGAKPIIAKETSPQISVEESMEHSVPSKSGYQLWVEANAEKIKAEHPDLEDGKFALHAVKTFKQLSADEKKTWNDKAKAIKENQPNEADCNTAKRKRTTTTTDSAEEDSFTELPDSPQMFEDYAPTSKETKLGSNNESVSASQQLTKRMRSKEVETTKTSEETKSKGKEKLVTASLSKNTVEKTKERSKLIGSKLSAFAFTKE